MNFYLQKYGFLPVQLTEKPDPDVGIIVVIPCYNETNLLSTLNSLNRCAPTKHQAEVIVVLNAGEDAQSEILKQNQQSKIEFENWKKNQNQSWLSCHLLEVQNLPRKHAGVGLARKIGMDEAVARFHSVGKDGIIVCFDADSLCDENYLCAIESHFEQNKKSPGCSIYFEHPTYGSDFAPELYQGIIQYELHLRYYNQALRYCQLPYGYHTIGSSMAVRSSAYQKQGGMNKRKAGEDFYFLHKIIALGNFTELNSTRVIPSPRESDRVPFGTGKAMGDILRNPSKEWLTYNFKSFKLIRAFVEQIRFLHESGLFVLEGKQLEPVLNFLKLEKLDLDEIRSNSTDKDSFVKRFFVWFDAFRVLKLVHYLRDHGYPNQSILNSAQHLLQHIHGQTENEKKDYSNLDLLLKYRVLEREGLTNPHLF